MIRIEGTRFGTIELEDDAIISFPNGIVGFPNETRFALLERAKGGAIAYLQSLTTPQLALPVMDGASFGEDYPNPTAAELAVQVGLETSEPLVLVVVVARATEPRLSANLLAPIIVAADTKKAAQVVLDPHRYAAAFAIPSATTTAPATTAAATATATATASR